jgi:nucleoside-diphosphate-sugar epimerase
VSAPDIAGFDDRILITGASGFIGARIVANLAERGFRHLRCFARPSGSVKRLEELQHAFEGRTSLEIVRGNLLSRNDCIAATRDISLIYHLAAGRGEKSYPDAFINSVVATRNVLDATIVHGCVRRFVSISSFSVYTNIGKERRTCLDESCPVELHPEQRGDAYSYAKLKQDELVADYGRRFGTPYVIIRPGFVYGPGNTGITGRVGIGTFGIFLHMGGSNPIPFTYVDNCAEAIVLAGLVRGIVGEVFNVVDDDLPTSRQFLTLYKQHVRNFRSLYVPHWASYMLCCVWERYAKWSEGQLPPVYGRKYWHLYWKKTRYSNQKLKARLGWHPRVGMVEALRLYFESCRQARIVGTSHEPLSQGT